MGLRTRALFLRADCPLPAGLNLRQVPFVKSWMAVEDVEPIELARAVRDAGWHFMWIDSDCSSTAWALSDETAVMRAITQALTQKQQSFNVAELGALRISRRLGFRVATVTVHYRQIQQSASLGSADGLPVRQLL